jgi:putative transposase
VSPTKRKRVVQSVMAKHSFSERRACKLVGQNRNTQRYKEKRLPDEDIITARIVELVSEYGRYGYRMITAMLQLEGHKINHKRVYRIWRTLGLKVPQRQPKRRRLWLNDGSCVRLRAEHKNHVWSYDFMHTRTSKGRTIKILNVIDEYTRECLISYPAFRLRSYDVQNILRDLFKKYGTPEYIRSDNGSEFIADKLREWFKTMEISPLYILPGSPWENGFVESFNGTMANELLNREIFDTLWEAQVLIKQWTDTYNMVRPHSALGYRPPAPSAWIHAS